MNKFFSKKRNRLIYLLIVYLPLIFPLIFVVLSAQSEYANWINIVAKYSFLVWGVGLLPASTLLSVIMLFTGWYKELCGIEQDNSYRELASITIITNILIIIGLSTLNS